MVTSVVNRYYDPTTDQFLSIDPALASTNMPYVFTNDNPLNSEDPLGLKGSPGTTCIDLSTKACKAQEKKYINGMEKSGASFGQFISIVEAATAVGCVVATSGLCGLALAAGTFGVDSAVNIVKHHRDIRSWSFVKSEIGLAAEDALLSLPDAAVERIFKGFAKVGSPLTRLQTIFVKSHPAVINVSCTMFCP